LKKDLISLADWPSADIQSVLTAARILKSRRSRRSAGAFRPLAGTTVALLFEKPSLRTRVTFDIAVTELGGHAVYLGPQEVGLGKRESVADIARNMSRWVHAIVARTFQHAVIQELANTATVPVINALTDRDHPCQALGDLLTIQERVGRLSGRTLAFVGDGNNVCQALMSGAAKLGLSMRIAAPAGYEPPAETVRRFRADAAQSGATIDLVRDARDAVRNSDAVYTDIWVSMGFESESETRRKAFARYQVNADLLSLARPGAIFLHCLPARRGEEVTDEVMDGPSAAVLDQAENRLHSAKSVLAALVAPALFTSLSRSGRRAAASARGRRQSTRRN